MIDNTLSTEGPDVQLSLIEIYKKKYFDALSIIENEVKDLIQIGQEMKGLSLYVENMNKIEEVHKDLSTLYSIIYSSQNVLKHDGSLRLRKLGHDLKPICSLINDPSSSREEIETLVIKGIREVGINRQSWLFNTCFLNELEYMIKVLGILIEPEFVPVLPSEENKS